MGGGVGRGLEMPLEASRSLGRPRVATGGALGGLGGPSASLWGLLGALLGTIWGHLGAILGRLGLSWAIFGYLGPPLALLGPQVVQVELRKGLEMGFVR